ncbi:MAG: 3-keto-5-aminohexanoate cleavage enzyme [Actinomycetota bacterium]|jgi:3-keto-5-aminohexanoate cleavage enzyme|nr:3-keto-5-aminohexanoate cleavage enzyme [Actinomycetota bacterium]
MVERLTRTAGEVYDELHLAIHNEAPIPTLAKPLVITVAPVGTFLSRENNPHIPYTPEENAAEAIAAYKEGAAVWHVHCRDENGVPTKDADIYKKTISMVLNECPDMVTSVNVIADYGHHGRKMIEPLVGPLAEAGPEFIRTVVVTAMSVSPSTKFTLVVNQETLVSEVEYILECGARPEFQLHGWPGAWNVNNWLIKPGILPRPYIMNMIMGWHAYHDASPTGDPWAQMWMVPFMNSLPDNSTIGATCGGRNWLNMTAFAIMMGVDQVRIGMEDSVFMYPHRDELIKSNAEVVRKVATIARELGREVATPAQAMEILGLTGSA